MGVNIKRLKLKNGIRVIIVPLKTNLTHISTNFLLGHRQEKKSDSGITHYCEHLLAATTSNKYKEAKYIADEIYRRGGYKNAYVNDYEMSIYISGFYKDLEFYMDILSNAINDFYIEKYIEIKEKKAVVQEYRNILSNYKFDFNIFKFLYPKYSYFEDYNRHIKTLKTFNNKKIKSYIKSHLNTDNQVITITCPSNKVKETIKNLKKYFGNIKYKKSKLAYPILKHDNTHLKIVNIKNDRKDANNFIVIHLSKSISYMSDEHLILQYIQIILFNFENGIFYNILRKKIGIIYSIRLYINIDKYDPKMSYYRIISQCVDKNVPVFIDAILDILKNYELVEEHIKNAKNNIRFTYENKKFYKLTTFNDEYKEQLLFSKDIIDNKAIYEKMLSIKPQKIKEYYKNVFAKELLSRHIFFYYSNTNINKTIETIYKKQLLQLPGAVYKSYYIK
jgi:predicted Zn-dependent peptidase